MEPERIAQEETAGAKAKRLSPGSAAGEGFAAKATPPLLEDRCIVELFLQREEAALQHCAEKYGSRLRGLALHILKDPLSAAECENDCYLAAWKSIPPHEPRSYLYAFLARITRHLALDRCRAQSRLKRSAFLSQLSAELEQCLPAPDDAACRLEELALAEALNSFLRSLSEEKRNIFLRRYWYLDSISQISQRFALSQSKVKSSLFRSRKQLREHLEKEGYRL